MRDIGMAPGHIIKLKKHIAEIKSVPTAPVPSNGPESGVTNAPVARSATSGAACGESGSLLDGPAFDEAAAAASFQEAVRAWREGGATKEVAEVQRSAGTRTVTQVPAQGTPKAGNSFWSKVGGDE